MDRREAPQDEDSTHAGVRKLLYAVDEQGRYTSVRSAGWEVEATATRTALEEIARLRDEAWERAQAGETAPLEVHMHDCRMDLPLLAGAAGLWRWRVRRHFDPARFARLPRRILDRYCEALGLDIERLMRVPPREGPEQ